MRCFFESIPLTNWTKQLWLRADGSRYTRNLAEREELQLEVTDGPLHVSSYHDRVSIDFDFVTGMTFFFCERAIGGV